MPKRAGAGAAAPGAKVQKPGAGAGAGASAGVGAGAAAGKVQKLPGIFLLWQHIFTILHGTNPFTHACGTTMEHKRFQCPKTGMQHVLPGPSYVNKPFLPNDPSGICYYAGRFLSAKEQAIAPGAAFPPPLAPGAAGGVRPPPPAYNEALGPHAGAANIELLPMGFSSEQITAAWSALGHAPSAAVVGWLLNEDTGRQAVPPPRSRRDRGLLLLFVLTVAGVAGAEAACFENCRYPGCGCYEILADPQFYCGPVLYPRAGYCGGHGHCAYGTIGSVSCNNPYGGDCPDPPSCWNLNGDSVGPGYYCASSSASLTGTLCPASYYCLGGRRDKQKCTVPAGSYCPEGTESSLGILCPPGYYCLGNTALKLECTSSPGYYCPGNTSSRFGIDCPRGYFCPGGSSNKQPCTALPGYYCPEKSERYSGSKCPPGFFCLGGTTDKIPCAATPGSACAEGSSTSTGTRCAAGSYCEGASAIASDCTCVPGFYCPEGSSTPSGVECPAGYFCAGRSADRVPCGAGTYSTTVGATVASTCISCGAGKYAAGTASTVCTSCTAGTYSTTVGATVASTCISCGAGKHQATAGSTVCTSCEAGKFSGLTAQTSSASCTSCAATPGSACAEGSSTSTGTRCAAGSYCEGASAIASDCTCVPGFYCPEGSSTPSGVECPAGYFCAGRSADRVPCGAGKYAAGTASTVCTSCTAGTYSTTVGATVASTCISCGAGKHQATAGSTVCTSCEAGKFSGLTAQTSAASCTSCAAGKYSAAVGASVASTCAACGAGTYSTTGSTVCTTIATPVVKMAVSLPMTKASFNTERQDLFKKSIAAAAEVSAGDVKIDDITTIIGGRRLLAESIRVDTSITATSEAAAKTMAQVLTADKMNAELSKNNLPKATVLEAPVFEAPKVAPPEAQEQAKVQIDKNEDAGSGGGVPLVGILVPIFVVVILAMAYFVCKRRREKSAVDQVPPSWKNKSGFHFVPTNFVLQIQKFMVESSCCAGTTERTRVVSVERVENEILWQMYKTSRDILKKTCAGQRIQSLTRTTKWQPAIPSQAELSTDINEFYLFHGTSSNIARTICEHGFDARLANDGLYGAGSYFAINSCKSHQYSLRESDSDTLVMLVCRVVMGSPYFTSTTHNGQRRPPENPATPGRPFDSIFAEHHIAHDGQQHHNEYVVFEKFQVYPEYIVRYTV